MLGLPRRIMSAPKKPSREVVLLEEAVEFLEQSVEVQREILAEIRAIRQQLLEANSRLLDLQGGRQA